MPRPSSWHSTSGAFGHFWRADGGSLALKWQIIQKPLYLTYNARMFRYIANFRETRHIAFHVAGASLVIDATRPRALAQGVLTAHFFRRRPCRTKDSY